MSTGNEQSTPRQRSVLYIVVSVVLVILAVWAVIAFSSARGAQRAAELADEFVQTLEENGATAPQPEVVARVLGDDGGAVCANPNQALSRATLYGMLTTGSGGTGERPIIADNKVLKGQLAIIAVYCPDQLKDFQEFVDSLETTDSANG